MHRTATISIILSDAKCSPICRAETVAHSDIEPSRSAKAFLQGGPKRSLEVIRIGAIQKLGYGFLFAFYSYYGRICSRL